MMLFHLSELEGETDSALLIPGWLVGLAVFLGITDIRPEWKLIIYLLVFSN